MIEVDISTETADRLHTILEGLGVAEEKVLKPALSRGLTAEKRHLTSKLRPFTIPSLTDFQHDMHDSGTKM